MDGGGRTGRDEARARSKNGDGVRARSKDDDAAARSKNLRRARAALVIGGILLAAGAGWTVWDAAGDDPPAPVVITGRGG